MVRFEKFFTFFLLTITVVTIFACKVQYANPTLTTTPVIWVASGLERIGLDDEPGETTRVELYAARGEYEPFQVGIRAPHSKLTNVSIGTSDLLGPNAQTISSNNVSLYREHYVHVSRSSPQPKGSTNLSSGSGWYADALIPFVDPTTQQDLANAEFDAVPFDVEAGKNQPIWFDVFVPRDTQAGKYKGTYTVNSDQGQVRGEIVLTVWDFELPLKPSLNSEFAFWEQENTVAAKELLKHKLMPEANDIDPKDERMLIDQWGLSSLSLPFWSGANSSTNKMDPPPPVSKFKAEAAKHESDLLLYVRYADEIDKFSNLFETTKAWARNIHTAGLLTAIAMAPTPDLYDDGSGSGRSAVDIWIVLAKDYDKAHHRVAEVMQKGNKVWSYNALVQDGYSPKWEIDFEPINFRIQPGFINQSLGLTGILYWRVDNWTKDPWNDVLSHSTDDEYFPGEGMLVYPGEQVGIQGVVPSMRLKWIREGVEDYEYVEKLKMLGHKDLALSLSRTVGADWKHWTQDPNLLMTVRRQIGDRISSLPVTEE